MKRIQFIVLLLTLLMLTGCGTGADIPFSESNAPLSAAIEEDSDKLSTAAEAAFQEVKENTKEDGSNSPETGADEKSVTAENKQTNDNESSDNNKPAEQPTDTKNEPASEQQPIPEPQSVSYSPDRVVSLAISKCQAGGMVTTEQHLKDNLNTGKITQEEYDEYYPLDGLEDSYYSVFVNVDLNKAATTSGRALGSEEEIAQYIADMLLLESDSVFNIRYTGTTKTSGETFYEFRCYR